MKIHVGFISTLGRLRQVDPAQVSALAASIKEVGLLNPITVYPRKIVRDGQEVDGFGLVAGAHRLEACKALGWSEVPVTVVDLPEDERIIAECDENLCGSKLTAVEQAMFTARRKEAYLRLHPETGHGKASPHKDEKFSSFADDQAAKTGTTARKVQIDAQRGSKITPEAQEMILGTHLDTGKFLDRVKALPKPEQAAFVRAELDKPKTKGAGKTPEQPQATGPDQPAAPADTDPHAAERRKLGKLTREALEDEVLGLRADLAEAKAKRRAAEAEADRLKQALADLTADDKSEVIRRQQREIKHLQSEMFRANEKARVAIVSARKAQDEAKGLRKQIENQTVIL
jgi:ParB family chromosome partitioning protein